MKKERRFVSKYKKIDKIVSMILLVIIIFINSIIFPIEVHAESNYEGLKLTAPRITSLNSGDTVTITISTDGEGIGSIDAYLTYDLSVFEQVTEDDVECIQRYWNVDMLDYNEELYGKDTGYLILSNSKGRTNTGDIATITLKVKNTTTETVVTMSDTYVVLDDNSSVGPLEDIECVLKVISQSTLTVNPNGGTWEGSTSQRTFIEDTGVAKQINNPTSTPNGNLVKFNSNGGKVSVLQTTQTTTFEEWTVQSGNGTINGTTYTFGTEDTTLVANYKGNSIILPVATKTGSEFLGWYDSNGNYVGNAEDIYEPEYTTPNAIITLTATYEEEIYTLTINPNGGTYIGSTSMQGTYNSTVTLSNPTKLGYTVTLDNNDGTGITKILNQENTFKGWTCSAGTIEGNIYKFAASDATLTANYTENAVTLESQSKEGYTFKGWYTERTGGTRVSDTYKPTEDITLYAQWEANKYTITFDPGQNATVNPTNKEVTYKETYGTLPTPIKPGHIFREWQMPDGKKVTENDIVNITEDTTLTAIWEGTEYIVTFNPNGGQVNPTSKNVINGNAYGTLPTPTKRGYTFKNWLNLNGNVVQSTTIVELTSDETLTAQWEANKYIITFDPGEDATMEEEPTKDVTHGEEYGPLPEPEKPGYTFEGWTTPDGEKIEEDDIVDIIEDITVTPIWKANEYKLTFDYNGGAGNISEKTIKNDEIYGDLPEATKEGNRFLGWYNDNGNKVESTDIVKITSDIILHARYEVNKYTVTFKNDNGTTINSIQIEHGSSVTYTGELPTKSEVAVGYEANFIGWDKEEELKNVTKDIIATATYKVSPIIYKITYYNTKNADNSANPKTYTIEDENINLVDLVSEGINKFKGWYTSNDENSEKITSIDTSKLGNIVLYAQWENDKLYFSSEKYKVGENDIDNYEDGDIYLDKIEPKTTVAELIKNCDTNGTITIINQEGKTLQDDDLVGTKMLIKVTRYDEEINLTAIVMGDLDGNGKVTATDLSALNQTILYRKTLEEPIFKAADLDDNKKLTATDLSTIKNTILKLIKLTYSKNQA